MEQILLVILILISIGLIAAILVQQKGSGAGAVFGGGSTDVYRSRRGTEKILHYFTIFLAFSYSVVAFGLIFV